MQQSKCLNREYGLDSKMISLLSKSPLDAYKFTDSGLYIRIRKTIKKLFQHIWTSLVCKLQTLSHFAASCTSDVLVCHLRLVNGRRYSGPGRPSKLGPSTFARGKCWWRDTGCSLSSARSLMCPPSLGRSNRHIHYPRSWALHCLNLEWPYFFDICIIQGWRISLGQKFHDGMFFLASLRPSGTGQMERRRNGS